MAYAAPTPAGSYSEERIMPAKWLTKLPDSIDDETAAAMMLKGMTSWYLLRRTYCVQPGDWILIYAAAGGVGTIATQWAQSLGAHVIGVVSTEGKTPNGAGPTVASMYCWLTAISSASVREFTDGEGLPVVYDPIGKGHVVHLDEMPQASGLAGELRKRLRTG